MNVSAVTQTIPVVTDADGVIRVANTRVPLETLIDAFQNGATAEEIAQQYPSISLADVYSVIGYYLHQRSEIEAYGVFEVSRHAPMGLVIDDLLLIGEFSLEDEWEGQVRYVPLR